MINTKKTFQIHQTSICLLEHVAMYIDNILNTDEEHLHTLDKVLHTLEAAVVRLNQEKCFLFRA